MLGTALVELWHWKAVPLTAPNFAECVLCAECGTKYFIDITPNISHSLRK